MWKRLGAIFLTFFSWPVAIAIMHTIAHALGARSDSAVLALDALAVVLLYMFWVRVLTDPRSIIPRTGSGRFDRQYDRRGYDRPTLSDGNAAPPREHKPFEYGGKRIPQPPISRTSQFSRNKHVYGEAGAVIGGSTAFDAGAVQVGAEGEKRTGAMLDQFLPANFANAYTFHGLKWPGSTTSDVDHVIMASGQGRTVLIVADSKFWKRHDYTFDGEFARSPQEDSPRSVKFDNAVRAMQDEYAGCEVYGYVVVHNATSARSMPGALCQLGTPRDFQRFLSSHLPADDGYVDLALGRRLVGQLKG